jgi:hypothetical protein
MSREYDLVYVNEAWELTEDDLGKADHARPVGRDALPAGLRRLQSPRPGSLALQGVKVAGKTTMLFSVHEDNPSLWNQAAGDWTDRKGATTWPVSTT